MHVERVGERAACAKIDGHVGGGIERDGAAWCAVVGKIHSGQSSCHVPLAQADGQFAAIRYNDAADTVEVFNDPFGMQALYVAERESRTYVSTSATALARHLSASPDALGAAMFLLAGRQFGPATHWRGVERLDPATVLTFSAARATKATYWVPNVDERVRGMSFAQTADHCARVVLSELESKIADEPCVHADITGGYDSRLVVAALARLNVRFTAQTSGEDEDEDVRLGREVASVGGFGWRQDSTPAAWTPGSEGLREAVGWGDGALDALQLSEVLRTQRRRRDTCGLVVTGGGGEHFGPSPWLHEFFRAGRSREINFDNLMSMRSLTPIDFSVLRRNPRDDVERYMRDALTRYSRFLSHELNTTQLDAVFVYRAVGHFGAYRSASEAYLRTEIPAYYKQIFLSVFSADHRYRNRHRLHRAVISRIHPRMSTVQTTHGGPAQRMRVQNAYRFAAYYAKLGQTAVRKLRRRTAAHATPPATSTAYRNAIAALRKEGVLDPRAMRSGGLYDAHRLEKLFSDAEQPDFGAWTQVGRIVTLELALESANTSALVAAP